MSQPQKQNALSQSGVPTFPNKSDESSLGYKTVEKHLKVCVNGTYMYVAYRVLRIVIYTMDSLARN